MNDRKRYLSLIFEKSKAELISEARRGYLGLLWWVIEPILFMSVFYVVFSLFNDSGEDAVSFLLVGLVVWKWFASSISQASLSIMVNKGLISQIYIPKSLFPIVAVTVATQKFLIIFSLLIVFLLITGVEIGFEWVTLPLIIFTQLMFSLSAGCLLSLVIPFFPDLKLLVENGILLLFFLSGIFFHIKRFPEEVMQYLYLNPMAGLIENYRGVILKNAWPDFTYLLVVVLGSAVLMWIALVLLKKFDKTYAKIL